MNNLNADGAQKLILRIIQNNTDKTIQFTTCCIEGNAPLAQKFLAAGSRVIVFDASSKFDAKALRRMVRFIGKSNFDILHAHLPYSHVFARTIGKVSGVSHVVSTQHSVPENYHPLTRVLERATRPLDTATIAVSDGVRRSFHSQCYNWELMLTNWYTIYNAIDVMSFNQRVNAVDEDAAMDRWNVRNDELVFLNVARCIPVKSQIDAIKAMSAVVRTLPNARLLIVGGGEIEDHLRRAVAELQLEEDIMMTGYVSDRIHELYAIADLFVSPSIHEGLPTTLLEAMASELPVVATNIPGVREVTTNETAVLVPTNSPSKLAEAMIDFRSESRRERYGQKGFERAVSKFDIEHIVSQHLDLYRNIMGIC